MKALRIIILFIFIALLIAIFTVIGYRKIKQNQLLTRTKLICENCVDTLLILNVNNTKLATLIRTKNTNNPILLFVHGGPGIPDMPFARKFDNFLVKDFIVVRYDQRGTRKSYSHYDLSKITIDDNVNDLVGLSKELTNLFPENQLFLSGQSWGTLISILAVQKEPELFDKYIGIGQIVNLKESDLVSFDYTMNKAKESDDKKSLDILSKLNRKDYNKNYESLSKQRRVLTKLGGRFYNNNIKSTLVKIAFIAPEYSIPDLYYIYRSARILSSYLYKDMLTYDFFTRADSLSVPVIFISGRYDYHTPLKTVKEYYNQLKNNDKELFIFEESGHIPNYEEPELFYETLLKEN